MKQDKSYPLWLACYIYYTKDPNELLVDKILPLITDIRDKGWAREYFFIRFVDKQGPHIRLRCKGDKLLIETKLKPMLKDAFPKSRFVIYRPELDRYGGENGIAVAEKIFQASSDVILSYLKENKEASYESILGFAFQLNMSMMAAFGMQKAEMAAFFNHMLSHNNTTSLEKKISTQHTQIFLRLSHLMHTLEKDPTFDIVWFNTWLKEIKDSKNTLQKLYQNNMLPLDPTKAHTQNPLWYLYESYVHMNNNRLGIYNIDEQYIAYVIKQAVLYEE